LFRSINKTIAWLKELDPQTAITPHFIRQLIKDDKVSFRTSGNKYIVDILSVKDYLGIA